MKKIFFCWMILCGSAFGWAQGAPSASLEPHFAAFIVSDLDTVRSWYIRMLGFEVRSERELTERGIRQANLSRGNAAVELIELSVAVHPDDLAEAPARLIGFFKFGYTVDRFDEWIAHLEQAGARFHGRVVADPDSGRRMVILLDPDGNRIQLFER